MRFPVRRLLAVALTVVIGGAAASDARAEPAPESAPARPPVVVDPQPGRSTAVPSWRIQSAVKVVEDGAAVSTPGYATPGWYRVSSRSTVLAGLIENSVHRDPFYS